MSDNQSSSLKSYIDSATGTVQSALGSLTGNTGDQVSTPVFHLPEGYRISYYTLPAYEPDVAKSAAKGDATKDKAAAEKDASHTVGKIGPYAVSSSGGISSDDPRRTEGSYDQTVGSAKEAVGGLLGAEGLKKEGQQQNAQGKGTEAEGQLSDYGQGLKDRVGGTLGGMAAGITGDREKQREQQLKHDDAKTKQRSAEHDIQKQADA